MTTIKRAAESTMLLWIVFAMGTLCPTAWANDEEVHMGSTHGRIQRMSRGQEALQPELQENSSPSRRDLMIGGERTGGRRYPFLVHWDVLTEVATSVRCFGLDSSVCRSRYLPPCLTRPRSPRRPFSLCCLCALPSFRRTFSGPVAMA
jgi:hypothetical protein